ncbi:MAG: sigma-54 dependent transcriptional regulator [Myxococcota bacterium]|nr:sigma-54 dependent transcriptional regulator [Myxococcota bacterium]
MSPTPRKTPSSPRKYRALVIDDAEQIREYLVNLLELKGFDVDTAADGRSGLALVESGAAPDVVLVDVLMPGVDGITTVRNIRKHDSKVPVVMLSVVGTASTIVEAMQAGATDYVNKPFDDAELEATLDKVIQRSASRMRRELSRAVVAEEAAPAVWKSAPMCEIRQIIDQIADTDVTVLIQGESGVGKEIVARAIHSNSTRSDGAFVKVNCAALPEDLLESELFGYEAGAFTGANGRKPGRFELANGGTIFLDEIGEMSAGLQAKLLHVLQEQTFSRLGGNHEIEVDVRVVCATHRPLLEMVADRTFREDLYFRLNVVNIEVPPLRERRDEIPQLTDTFLRRYSACYEKPLPQLSTKLSAAFDEYDFPGNVRELENLLKRLVVLESEDSILDDLQGGTRAGSLRASQLEALLTEVEETAGEVPLREVGRRVAMQAERETIGVALDRTQWNRKQAAKMLGVSYKTLLQKIRDCGIEAENR